MPFLKLNCNDLFSENVLLNDFQTSFHVKVDVTRRYNDIMILVQKAYTESIKAKLHTDTLQFF